MVGIGVAVAGALGAAGQFASGILSSRARQAEFAEQLRQLEMKKTYTLSLAKTRAAASGTTLDSNSTVNYLAGLTTEFDREIASLRKTKSIVGQADLLGNLSGLVGSGMSTYGNVGALNNWWR